MVASGHCHWSVRSVENVRDPVSSLFPYLFCRGTPYNHRATRRPNPHPSRILRSRATTSLLLPTPPPLVALRSCPSHRRTAALPHACVPPCCTTSPMLFTPVSQLAHAMLQCRCRARALLQRRHRASNRHAKCLYSTCPSYIALPCIFTATDPLRIANPSLALPIRWFPDSFFFSSIHRFIR